MQPQVLINLLALAILCVAIYHGVIALARKVKESNAKKLEAAQKANEVMVTLAVQLNKVKTVIEEAVAVQEKILTGTTKACEAIAITTEKHRETVAALGKLLLAPGALTDDRDALTSPSEEDRNKLFAEMAFRAKGHSPEVARDLAEAEIEREGSMPNF